MTIKNKIITGIMILILLVMCWIFIYPLSFKNVISETDNLNVFYIESGIKDGSPQQEWTEYHFLFDSNEVAQIKKILQKYSYHRSIRTWFGDDVIDGNDAGYGLYLYFGDNSIIFTGTNEIFVNNHVYRVGYGGNQKVLSLMEDIRSVLDN